MQIELISKNLLSLFLIGSLSLVSCSKDDSDNNDLPNEQGTSLGGNTTDDDDDEGPNKDPDPDKDPGQNEEPGQNDGNRPGSSVLLQVNDLQVRGNTPGCDGFNEGETKGFYQDGIVGLDAPELSIVGQGGNTRRFCEAVFDLTVPLNHYALLVPTNRVAAAFDVNTGSGVETNVDISYSLTGSESGLSTLPGIYESFEGNTDRSVRIDNVVSAIDPSNVTIPRFRRADKSIASVCSRGRVGVVNTSSVQVNIKVAALLQDAGSDSEVRVISIPEFELYAIPCP
ncbi:MAG: hypothetical protein HRU19_00130 [Pseudobacteriovorax sp.]|nr:hypothetical protein [Pseudobacteriovorax sp.]